MGFIFKPRPTQGLDPNSTVIFEIKKYFKKVFFKI